jgi:hypothetical protein
VRTPASEVDAQGEADEPENGAPVIAAERLLQPVQEIAVGGDDFARAGRRFGPLGEAARLGVGRGNAGAGDDDVANSGCVAGFGLWLGRGRRWRRRGAAMTAMGGRGAGEDRAGTAALRSGNQVGASFILRWLGRRGRFLGGRDRLTDLGLLGWFVGGDGCGGR